MLPSARRSRAGFSLVELLLVVTTLAVMFAMVAPRVTTLRESTSLRAGRQQFAAAFSAARAAALQKGRQADVIINGNEVNVHVFTGLTNTRARILGPIRFDGEMGMLLDRIGGAPDSVSYNARGMMATVIPGSEQLIRYRLQIGAKADTVCISGAGLILPKGCSL